jgi:hypothetical protein
MAKQSPMGTQDTSVKPLKIKTLVGNGGRPWNRVDMQKVNPHIII